MGKKRIGVDLGTHSLGLAIRNTDISNNSQIENAVVVRYEAGVGTDSKSNEFSYSSEKTMYKSRRKNLRSERDRKLNLLKWLIKAKMCPLSEEDLRKWKRYEKFDKENSRKFPLDNNAFIKWLSMDFTFDDSTAIQPDFENIFELKAYLADSDLAEDPRQLAMMGRAFYHTCLNRGFKSSKKVSEKFEIDDEAELLVSNLKNTLIGAEKKKASKLKAKLDEYNFDTVSQYFAELLIQGKRVRDEHFPEAIRKLNEDEFDFILKKQNFKNAHLIKKIRKSVFWQNPLQTQKGKIANCPFEPSKPRCYRSHYLYEEFVVWQFLANLKIDGEFISLENKKDIFNKYFLNRLSQTAKFNVLKNWLIDNGFAKTDSYFNFKDKQIIYLCPSSARFYKLLGEGYKNKVFKTNNYRNTKSKKLGKTINYDLNDFWHILKDAEHHSDLVEIFSSKFNFDNSQIVELLKLSNTMQDGYGSLSLKAVKNILPFLKQNFSMVEAILLAKIPDIIKSKNISDEVISKVTASIVDVKEDRKHIFIINQYIANWKENDQKVGFKTSYNAALEKEEIIKLWQREYGLKSWDKLEREFKQILIDRSIEWLQTFFDDAHRSYLEMPTYRDKVKNIVNEYIEVDIPDGKRAYILNKLYHPSEKVFYNQSQTLFTIDNEVQYNNETGEPILLLESPSHAALKNPKVLRGMNILKRYFNNLLKEEIIDCTTEVIIEIARDMEDINKAKAYQIFQNNKNEERIKIKELLKEFADKGKNVNISRDEDQQALRYAIEQTDLFSELKRFEAKTQYDKKFEAFLKKEHNAIDKLVSKILLWKEQSFQCLYSGDVIPFNDLFQQNHLQIEHTIPVSRCLDNSMKNKTIATAKANGLKNNRMPYELGSHWHNAILQRIKPWIDRVAKLKERRDFWKEKAKKAQAEDKDDCTVQKHLWQFELDYWQGKVKRFEMKEIKSGFVSAQINDTRTISKYVRHYLKDSGVFHKVKIVKGGITSEYRKILNIQKRKEQKDRTNHTHHAIDAAVLTLIPNFPMERKVLKTAAEYYEKTKKQYHGFKPYSHYHKSHLLELKDSVMVKYDQKNQLFTPFKRVLRKRGKKIPLTHYNKETKTSIPVYKKDENGNIIFRTKSNGDFILKRDHNGKIIQNEFDGKIPLPEYVYQKGTGYRGQIFEESFYSVKADEKKFSKRIPVADAIKKLNQVVDENLKENLKNETLRIKAETKLLKDKHIEAVDYNIYQTNKNGYRAIDKNENEIKIRHVRCYIPAKKTVKVKQHKDSKNHFYRATPASYPYAGIFDLSSDNEKDKSNSKMVSLTPLDIINAKKTNSQTIKDLFEKHTTKDGILIEPKYVLQKKLKIILIKDQNEITEIIDNPDEFDLHTRLFEFISLENDGRLIFSSPYYTLEKCKNLNEIAGVSKRGSSVLHLDKKIGIYRLSKSNWNFIVEGYDFKIDVLGKIKSVK